MKTAAEMRDEIARKAAEDPAMRERLVEDPKGTINEMFGIGIPEGFQVRVHEEDASTAHVVLPPPAKLDPSALEAAAGGFSSAPESMNVLNW